MAEEGVHGSSWGSLGSGKECEQDCENNESVRGRTGVKATSEMRTIEVVVTALRRESVVCPLLQREERISTAMGDDGDVVLSPPAGCTTVDDFSDVVWYRVS